MNLIVRFPMLFSFQVPCAPWTCRKTSLQVQSRFPPWTRNEKDFDPLDDSRRSNSMITTCRVKLTVPSCSLRGWNDCYCTTTIWMGESMSCVYIHCENSLPIVPRWHAHVARNATNQWSSVETSSNHSDRGAGWWMGIHVGVTIITVKIKLIVYTFRRLSSQMI